tara:strand:+ start:830 stop:1897 length:1068 start_codon:yes stop_codon:yes gene_type:complete
VSKDISIQSHKGEYTVHFTNNWIADLLTRKVNESIFIVDSNIAEIYKDGIQEVLSSGRSLIIHASEDNKSLDKCPDYVNSLVDLGVKRGNTLIAVGGGITQDITCFLASTMMRGLPWVFYPTTLLAQADSCIGSKSSINSGEIKNILGTFTPPEKIILDVGVLKTLEATDIHSGIGEMIKVHAINSPESFNKIADAYDEIITQDKFMEEFIYASLLMKKKLIEIDEFDVGPRNVMNYGHSFGHAIETATNYSIPHGIAVTIGMDMANFVASKLGITKEEHFIRMHEVLEKNAQQFRKVHIDCGLLLNALSKDKKNTSSQLRLILPDKSSKISIGLHDKSTELEDSVKEYCQLFQV